MDIQALLGILENQNLGNLVSELGGNEKSIRNGLEAALPAMLAALNKNTQSKEGAESLLDALDKKHNGSILNDIDGYLKNPDLKDGNGILNHLFGGQTAKVADAISNSSGLNSDSTIKMLQMLAPILMGVLGKEKRENNLDATGLDSLTSTLANAFENSNSNGSGIMNLVTNMLDTNKDGSVVDDLLGMAGKFFFKK